MPITRARSLLPRWPGRDVVQSPLVQASPLFELIPRKGECLIRQASPGFGPSDVVTKVVHLALGRSGL